MPLLQTSVPSPLGSPIPEVAASSWPPLSWWADWLSLAGFVLTFVTFLQVREIRLYYSRMGVAGEALSRITAIRDELDRTIENFPQGRQPFRAALHRAEVNMTELVQELDSRPVPVKWIKFKDENRKKRLAEYSAKVTEFLKAEQPQQTEADAATIQEYDIYHSVQAGIELMTILKDTSKWQAK